MASIFAQLGFDGLFLGRIDYQDKKYRFKTKNPEGIWLGSNNLGKYICIINYEGMLTTNLHKGFKTFLLIQKKSNNLV